MLYIAYGSNISEKRMHQRCPNAKFVLSGYLDHTVLCFHHYANIERAHDYETPVVLWDIPEEEVSILDREEGFPKHYKKEKLVMVPEPQMTIEEMTALVGGDNVFSGDFYDAAGIWGIAYVMTDWKMNEWEKHSTPTTIEYAEHIITGYKEQGWSGGHLHDLWYALYRGENRPESRS